LKHPFTAVLAGPSFSGKTYLLRKILERADGMIETAPEKIIWCHGISQPAHDEMMQTIPNIEFVEGLPNDLETRIDPTIRHLIVIDNNDWFPTPELSSTGPIRQQR